MLDNGKKLALVALMLVSVLLGVAAVMLMRHVESLLASDLRIGLTEIASQNRDAIASRLSLVIHSVETGAKKLGEELDSQQTRFDAGKTRKLLSTYGQQNNSVALFVADATGRVERAVGSPLDVSGRLYFRLAKKGMSNISDNITSLVTGDDIFIVSAPIYVKGKFAGTLQTALKHDAVYKLLLPPLFASRGIIYLIKNDGYVLIDSTSRTERVAGSGNFYRDLYLSGNPAAAQQIEHDAQAGRSGFIETESPSGKAFSVYAPIDKTQGWVLVVSVPQHTVFPNGGKVVELFYFVLFLVVLVSAVCAASFMWYRARQQKRLVDLAFVDGVTGGATYARFENATLRAFAATDKPVWIAKADIDNFKYINQFHGFEFGNAVLRAVYHRFATQLQATETAARIANDDFVLLLADVDDARLNALFGPIEYEGVHIYLSAGIFPVTDRRGDLNTMVDKARVAAEKVKGSALQCYARYTQALDQLSAHNENMKHKIRAAIENDEFLPYFQPKYDIATGQVVGCEALARWRAADGQLVSPADFIPVCERTGLVLELDWVMYQKSLLFLQRRLSLRLPCVPVSVNFSKLHLGDCDFAERVRAALQRYQVPAFLIQVEITESAFLENFGEMEAALNQLRQAGLQVAMDDFGAGYSSLNMLKKMPIDVLKIDREFLDLSAGHEKRDAIFAGVVQIARNIGLQVVVEGVETADDVALMRACGCTVAQGYYYARPLPEDAFEQLLVQAPGEAAGQA